MKTNLKTRLRPLGRIAYFIIAWILIVAGIIVTPMPMPVGLIMVVIGVSILVTVSPWARKIVLRLRRRHRYISDKLNQVKDWAPAKIRRVIESTDPNPKQRKLSKRMHIPRVDS